MVTYESLSIENGPPQKKPSFFSRAWNGELGFKFYWTLYYVVMGCICAILIRLLEKDLAAIDVIFLATAVSTTAALTTVEMNQVHTGTFCIMCLFGLLGCVFFMLIPTIVYRRHCFVVIDKRIKVARARGLIPPYQRLPLKDRMVIDEYHLLYRSLSLLYWVLVRYLYICLLIGILTIFGALNLRPNLPELVARGYTRFDNAVMLTISGFANTGLCLMSDNIMGLANNPLAYVLISFLILLGNTGIPVALRFVLVRMLQFEELRFRRWNASANPPSPQQLTESIQYRQTLQYILDNPRKHTTHLFSTNETILLGRAVVGLILIQYVFYLGCTLNRPRALENNSVWELAGIGYFQTLSTRAAGFTIVDLRTLNPGLIVVYACMMYVAATPFVSALHQTTITSSPIFKRIDLEDEEWLNRQKTNVGNLIHQPLRVLKNPTLLLQPLAFQDPNQQQQQQSQQREISTVDENPLQSELQLSVTSSKRMRRALGGSANPNEKTPTSPPSLIMPPSDVTSPDGQGGTGGGGGADQKPTFAKKFLLRHSFFILACVILLAFSEDKILSNPKYQCNVWYIMFEVIAAYGGPGLSMGVPGKWYSLSGEFTTFGKCVIIFLMYLGIHRGLPNKNDEVVDFKFVQYKLANGFHDDMVSADDPEVWGNGIFGKDKDEKSTVGTVSASSYSPRSDGVELMRRMSDESTATRGSGGVIRTNNKINYSSSRLLESSVMIGDAEEGGMVSEETIQEEELEGGVRGGGENEYVEVEVGGDTHMSLRRLSR